MNNILFLLWVSCLSFSGWAQTSLPKILEGTWKLENEETYEHWNVFSDQNMKGISYKFKNNKTVVNEYLEISLVDNEIIYTATVVGQNEGKGISFTLVPGGSSLVFENPQHDFPKKIEYQILSENEMFVTVSDGAKKGFSYILIKQNPSSVENTTENPNYDAALATKLEADDLGMRSFVFVILKTGSNTTTDKDFINQAFRGHLDNINRLVKENKLVVAGPMGKNENNYRGIFIFTVSTIEEAQELLKSDPAVESGILEADLYRWYGSAALPEYLPFADRIWKKKP